MADFLGLPVTSSPYLDADRVMVLGPAGRGMVVQGTRTDSPGYQARVIVRDRWAELEAEAAQRKDPT